MLKRMPRQLALILAVLCVAGCGQSPPAPKPVEVPPPKITLAPTPKDDATQPAPAANVATNATPAEANYAHAAFLGNDVVALAVLHPQRIAQWPLYQALQQANLLKNFERQYNIFGIKPESIRQASLIVDQSTVNHLAQFIGLEVSETDVLKSNLRSIGVALFSYHQKHGVYPRADGDGEGTNTGLSWRVHLLPFMDQADLFDQFHLDEPWDSDHNKTLIDKMPEVFQSPVADAGQTSVHVFVGKNTPFGGERGIAFTDITDGTDNTIQVVRAGVDTADVWTKPGGLTFDPEAPKKALGDVEDNYLVMMFDGSIHRMSKDIDDQTMANLIQMNDGSTVEFDRNGDVPPPQLPPMILSLVDVADRPAIVKSMLNEAEQVESDGLTLYTKGTTAICFEDDKTIVCGPMESVQKMVATKRSGKPGSPDVLRHLEPQADLSLAIDIESQLPLVNQAAQLDAKLVVVQQVKSIALQMSVTAKPGSKLLELVVTAVNPQTAEALAPLASGALEEGQRSVRSVPLPGTTENHKQMTDFIGRLVQSASIRQEGDQIRFLVPVPEDFDKLTELMAPMLQRSVDEF